MEDSRLNETLGLLGICGPFGKTEGTQLNTRLKEIIRTKGAMHLLGSSDADITQWLSLAQSISLLASDVALKNLFSKLNVALSARSFCVGQSLTVADAALFQAITGNTHFNSSVVSEFVEVGRWMDHISFVCTGRPWRSIEVAPTVFPAQSGRPSRVTDVVGKPEVAEKSGEKRQNPSGAGEAAADAGSKKKKEKAESKVAPPVETTAELDPSKLDIRVGLVKKCWAHPESDKLYCEEIDVGEETVRSIASGLRAFYASASDIEGRKVLVLANLKERPLAGFKSQGMVLCASNEEHTVVQLVDPPAGSRPGDRVTFKGFDGEPANPAQMAKKKIFEKLAPQLRTDDKGVAHWGEVPFTIDGDLCIAPSVPNAHVA